MQCPRAPPRHNTERTTTIARPPRLPTPPRPTGPRVGKHIRAAQVRVIDQNGEMLGVMTVPEAMEAADAVGLDLVEVSPGAEPPVCKFLDYSKFKYEQQKKAAEARKKSKTVGVKEVKLRPGIEAHDFDVKARAARRFIEGGHKVKISLRFRGREITHQDLGRAVVERLIAHLDDIAKVETPPKLESKQILAFIVPDPTKSGAEKGTQGGAGNAASPNQAPDSLDSA